LQTDLVSQPLVSELARVMRGGGSGAADAEIALGDGPLRQRLKSTIRALAEHRGPGSSTCPSDCARAIGGENWRALMPEVRELARELAKSGDVQITQGDKVLDPAGTFHGPIRIRTVA
jgi:hypothetical protein